MKRQQVMRRQLIAVLAVLAIAGIVVAVNAYLRTFAHQVHLGKLVSVSFSVGGPPAFTWTDPQDLAKIRAALPKYQPGSGYAPYTHSHQSMTLMLTDDKNRVLFLALPSDESSLVLMNPREPDYPVGNTWNMPELLGVIGEIGLKSIKDNPAAAPMTQGQLEFWAKTYGAKQA